MPTYQPTHLSNVQVESSTATKKNPGQSTVPGSLRLLPQLVGSFDPGGGCRGMGAARVGPLNPNSKPTRITCNLAALICLPVAPGATVCPAGETVCCTASCCCKRAEGNTSLHLGLRYACRSPFYWKKGTTGRGLRSLCQTDALSPDTPPKSVPEPRLRITPGLCLSARKWARSPPLYPEAPCFSAPARFVVPFLNFFEDEFVSDSSRAWTSLSPAREANRNLGG
jgi:hypothetical protein